MLTLLALVASCQGLSTDSLAKSGDDAPLSPPPKTTVPEVEPVVTLPGGQLVTRQCFATSRGDYGAPTGGLGASGYGSGGGGGYGTRGSSARSSAAPPPPPAAPAAAPVASAPTADASVSYKPTTQLSLEGDAAPAKKAGEAGRAQSLQAGPPADGLAVTGANTRDRKAEAAPMEEAEAASVARAEKSKDDAARPARMLDEESRRIAPEPNLDWGATVYLSNDDSMSLASAQRLLWAVQKRGPVKTSEVRPHELLNYFSFETDPVAPGDTFSVRPTARETAPGTLTMAFAVKGVTPARKPLDLTLVLDRSGSMSAEGRMEYLKRGLLQMTENLKYGDRVDLVLFDDQICTPIENFVVGRDDPSILTATLNQLAPRGSTDLDAGLREGYRIANARTDGRGRNRRMMLISDALLNTGNVDPALVTEVGKAYEQSNIRLTAIGVGREFNDKVLDMLSEKGKGAYVYLGSEAVVDRVFGVGFSSLTQTVAHDVRFALDLPPSLAMERFYGEEASTDPEEVQPIHYYAGTTQLFLQDLKMRSGRVVSADPVTLTIEYTDVDTNQRESQVVRTTVGALLQADSRNLDKARALMGWTDLVLARSLGADPCGAPFATWQERVGQLGPDAEVGWLDSLTAPLCDARPVEPIARAGVPYKVRVDSDTPIAEVALACGSWSDKERLSGSDTVASFTPAAGASCTLTLAGTVPMAVAVKVPTTGADLRCMVRGGRVSCS